MDILKWNELLIKHPQACTQLFCWITKKEVTKEYRVDQKTLINALKGKNLFESNEEKLFSFLDDNIIFCGVYAIGFKRFISFAQSEYRGFVCTWHDNRNECTEQVISNGLYLLEERINNVGAYDQD